MNQLTKEFLLQEYKALKKNALEYYEKGRFNSAINLLTFSSKIAEAYPILKEFIDDETESILTDIATKILVNSKCQSSTATRKTDPSSVTSPANFANNNNGDKRIVFYNGQIIDSGALTEQYLYFFLDKGYSVLFIVPDINNTVNGSRILEFIAKEPKVELFIPHEKNSVSMIRAISHKIDEFKPTHAFLHFLPADTVGFCSFVHKKHLKRYYIVHNDHTFWLGKACSDYFIEFRKFGYQLSHIRRGIDQKKLLLVPFYPIFQNIPFQGFPFDREGKVVGFSAANLYKYYKDPELKLFHVIKDLLLKYPDFVFCLAGYGNAEILNSFIKEYKLENRFYYLGKRSDFYNLVGNVDILFESYPFKGGLTVLYAVLQNIAITGMANMKSASQTTSEYFDFEVKYNEPDNFNRLEEDASQLITSAEKRKERADLFKIAPNTKQEFQRRLTKVMNDDTEDFLRKYDSLLFYDDDYALSEYLSLPKLGLDFNIRKYIMLKNELSLTEKIHIANNLFKNDDFYFKNRVRWVNVLLRIYRILFKVKSRNT